MMKDTIKAMFQDGRAIHYNARYCPETNPIELTFGIIKRRLKSDFPQQPRDLIENVKKSVGTLSAEDCKNTIRHVFENFGFLQQQ